LIVRSGRAHGIEEFLDLVLQMVAFARQRMRSRQSSDLEDLPAVPEAIGFASWQLAGKNPYLVTINARIILFSAALLPSSQG